MPSTLTHTTLCVLTISQQVVAAVGTSPVGSHLEVQVHNTPDCVEDARIYTVHCVVCVQDNFANRRARYEVLMLDQVWRIRTNSRHTEYAFRNEHRHMIKEVDWWDNLTVWGGIGTGAATAFAAVSPSAALPVLGT
jgi:hypothetical protein